ncbi:hypothetical protein BS636_04375 [Acinetobacter sp. LoGeW2-3]|uniref:hypothetical protein n=1 Tax=Acinetobacter sp. LoGeW2-3 TaxID=1808001 RepID=UPI000C05CB87|nr:hypothetical protein [Acinetobacter sp. LoGeW2-3]ATO18948.1 hypothetical protein BS636_04375 [Acinetobacter sp. LoGeW2-3]
MKKLKFTTLLITFAIAGCQKQPEQAEAAMTTDKNSVDVIQFEQADQKISNFLDQLDNPATPMEVRKQIICKDYPEAYFKEYVPAFMKIAPENTKEQLEQDLKLALDFYKKKDNVVC